MTYTVLEARFVMSAPTLKACEEAPAALPEVAFIGRSNVGKSSLIGELCQRKKLVKTSRTPGATRAVNFFQIELRHDDSGQVRTLSLADLPGYGWARVSRKERLRMSALISGYLGSRAPLRCVCQLLDLRHTPTVDDKEVAAQLAAVDRPWVLVATKADKLGASKRKPARKEMAQVLGRAPADVTLFSAPEHFGREEIWQRVWAATGAHDEDAPSAPPDGADEQAASEA